MTTEVRTRRIAWVRPSLYPKQEAALFDSARFVVVEASTKAGKTVGCLAWVFEMAVLRVGVPGRVSSPAFWWVAPIRRLSGIAYRRAKAFLPVWMYRANDTAQTLILINGSTISFLSADNPDTLYGEDVYGAVIDEATRCSREAWVAVRSTLTATQAPARIIGNVKGSKNWAYKMARRAEAGAAGMHYAKITAWDAVEAGVISATEVEAAREDLTEAEFRELYMAEAADTDDQFFHVERFGFVQDWPRHGRVCRVWDFAVTQKTTGNNPDFTVGAKLAWDGQKAYVVDVVSVRDTPDGVVDLVLRTVGLDGRACEQGFEEEKGAAGAMMLEQWRRMLAGVDGAGRVFAAPVTGDKPTRAFMFAARVNDGDVDLVVARWNDDFVEQCSWFPDGDHDDQVDAAAHAYNRLVPRTYGAGRVRVPGGG